MREFSERYDRQAEKWFGFDPTAPPEDRAKDRSFFFVDLLNQGTEIQSAAP
jgi:hypothetical protein